MFVFTRTSSDDDRFDKETVRMEVYNDEISWPDLMEKFAQFLRGCGYSFTNEDMKETVKEIVESDE